VRRADHLDCHEIWAPETSGILRACPGLHKDCFICVEQDTEVQCGIVELV
jgi:hypothetical protein